MSRLVCWLVFGACSSLSEGSPLLLLESQYLGAGLFEYRLAFNGAPYLERNGLTEFRVVSFPGFDGGMAVPAEWKEAPEFPAPIQTEASLRWLHDDATPENLPYHCTFRVRSQKKSFRLGTASVRFILHWNDWAQPPDLRTNVQGASTLQCVMPCDPEQSDGSASLHQDVAGEFPQPKVQTISLPAPYFPRLGLAARTGLPLCIETAADMKSWHRIGYTIAAAGETVWRPEKPAAGAAQFYRAVVESPGFAHPEALASTQWLENHLGGSDLRIVDARYPQSDTAFQGGHIPGAVKVDPLTDLLDPASSPLMLVPTAAQFEALMSRLGISNTTTVVVYDLEGGLWCARLWWALRYYGHQPVKLLNGGLLKWQQELRPLEKTVIRPGAATFRAQAHPKLRALLSEVRAAMGNTNMMILDALSADHHTGKTSDMPGLPAGHIPSAINFPAPGNLDPASKMLRLPPEKLSALHEAVGLKPDKTVITYCGGGYYGAFSLFVLHQLGYEDVRLYDGSWLEWTAKGGSIATGP